MRGHFPKIKSLFAVAIVVLAVGVLGLRPIAVLADLPVVDVPGKADRAASVVAETVFEKPWQVGFMQIVWNLFQYATNRIAYEAAVALATGATGGDPLVELRSGDWLGQDVVYDIVGTAIDSLGQSLELANLHFDLCNPSSLGRLNIRLGLMQTFAPNPKCQFTTALTAWTNVYTSIVSEKNALGKDPTRYVLGYFANAINPRGTELTASISIYSQVFQNANQKKSFALAEYLANHGYKPVADVISGQVETPASFIEQSSQRMQDAVNPHTGINQYWEMMTKSPELWKYLGLGALSTFGNTFLSVFTDRLLTGFYKIDIPQSTDSFDVASITFKGGKAAAETYFKTVFATQVLSLDHFSAMTEFTSCPASTTRQLNTCTMDADFATAVGGSDAGDPFTVQEAIDEGLLHGDWPFVAENDKRNLDTDCYTYGYCYSNLVKLRIARIIPVGWEMAASLQGSDSQTLQQLVDEFDSCDADGARSTSYPYCHLIDPNWVLAYPSTQCKASVHGQLVANNGSSRFDECVDAPSCIAEDSSGSCVGGYGYCMQEKNTYEFRGQSCPEQYGTCLSMSSDSGTTADLLFNTVDESVCDSSNAGCLWYETTKTAGTDGTYDWPTINNLPAIDTATATYQDRVYFNSTVDTCDSGDAGCHKVVIDDNGDTELNLVMNPSFEDDTNSNSVPDYWFSTGTPGYDTSGNYAVSGDAAVNPGSGVYLYQRNIPIQGSMFYTFSFYAAQPSSTAANTLTAYLITDSADGSESVDLTGTSYTSSTCTLTSLDTDTKKESLAMSATPISDSYQRYTCTFTSPTLKDPSIGVRVAFLDFAGDVLVDGVQLEATSDVSTFRDGYGQTLDSLNLAYYKLPPAYLGCDGSDSDPTECDQYAQVCSSADVGCDLYTPTNGNPAVPGIAGDLDACPSECVGYDTYKQEPTTYEPSNTTFEYFIPDTAVSCSADYVGCTEFTNLSTEATETYTYLRACLTTDQTTNEAVYYTWEGSDLEGFQLKSWTLLKSDLNASPCTTWGTTSSTITCADVATTDTGCDAHDDIFTEPDCREFYDTSGTIFYRRYSDTVSVTDSCTSYRKTETVGDTAAERLSNCTSAGGYYAATTGDCRFYGIADESDTCPAAQNGCREYTGGAGRNSSIIYSDDFEDEDMSEYVLSSASTASAEISNESVATDGHSLHEVITTANGYVGVGVGTMSDTCTTSGGCSADSDGACAETGGCEVEVGTLGFTCTIAEGETVCGELTDGLAAGKIYVLNFWAKSSASSATVTPGFIDTAGTGTSHTFGSATLSTSWKEYTVGPLDTSSFTAFDNSAKLYFSGAKGDDFYIDNITLRQTEEDVDVIKDSWVTPSTCDETNEGAVSAQYHLGCQEYTNAAGETVDLQSFTRLCDEAKIGCSAFYDTQNSASPNGKVFNVRCDNADGSDSGTDPDIATSTTDCKIDGETVCTIGVGSSYCLFNWDGGEPRDSDGAPMTPDTATMSLTFGPEMVTVKPDQKVYFVADSAFACDSSVMGCMETGKPTFSNDQTVVNAWESTYLLNLPDSYDTQLCQSEALFCDAWTTTDNATYYFKNPNDKTCEYQSNVNISGTSYSGWFRTGTTSFCYGSGACENDDSIACETDSDCASQEVSLGTCGTDGTCSDDSTQSCLSNDDCITDGGSCQITTGSYVSGGTASGIWHNGDGAYDGWGGTCDAQYDKCTEFIDPVDTGDQLYGEDPGQSYFFINDALLDDSNLSTSKQCNGQVSEKKGCVLFNDILQGELTYNASATYIRSIHAQDFDAGAISYDLVDPITCPDAGTVDFADSSRGSVDLCTQRCAYDTALLHPYDTATGTTYTGSCLIDADCANATSDGGDLINGSCESGVTALEDDTNTVQKVNLSRACAEWLSCDSTTTVWDTSINAYKITCDSVGACDEYTALGETSFCANWKANETPSVLTMDRYTSRDVGWYGREYSGYSIPYEIQPQFLSQVNVSPASWCTNTGGDAIDGTDYGYDTPYIDCSDDATICPGTSTCSTATEDYRLVYYAGACAADSVNGDSCTIGFCSDTGEACGNDDECDSGDCATGYCAYYPSSSTTCTTNSDCSDSIYDTCIDSKCRSLTSTTCTSADLTHCDGAGTATCVQAAATQTGACFNNRCLLNPVDADGNGEADTFTIAGSEALACRGWPETDSPFPNEVVDTWKTPTDPTAEPVDEPVSSYSRPYGLLSTFEKVNTCVGDQECLCSYEKVTYGTSSTKTRYYDSGATVSTYICVDGTYDGASCDAAGVVTGTTTCADGGGVCSFKASQNSMVGWEGFCLERDARTQVNGDSSQDACLTWLPIDRLAGASDIYGKYTGAGYPLQDVYMCGDVNTYMDVYTSSMACATQEDGSYCEYADGSGVRVDDLLRGDGNAVCPENFYAVLGRCIDDNGDVDGNDPFEADTTSSAYTCLLNPGTPTGYGNHPYFCVPEGGVSTQTGEKCKTPTELGDDGLNSVSSSASLYLYDTKRSDYEYVDTNGDGKFGAIVDPGTSAGNVVYKVFGEPDAFDRLYNDYYQYCGLQGVDYFDPNSPNPFEIPTPSDDIEYEVCKYNDAYATVCTDPATTTTLQWTAGTTSRAAYVPYTNYYNLNFTTYVYPGCSTILQVSSADEGNTVWTDRALFRNYSLQSYGSADMAYTPTTTNEPYGAVSQEPTLFNNELDPDPARAVTCQDSTGIYLPRIGGECDDATWDRIPNTGTTDARSYWAGNGVVGGMVQLAASDAVSGHEDPVYFNIASNTASVMTGINEVFARAINYFTFDLGDGDFTDEDYGSYGNKKPVTGGYAADVTATGDAYQTPTAPVIRSVGDTCVDEYCQEGTDNSFSLNGYDDKDLTGTGGQFLADLKFYVEANPNQMPIRRMIIDWEDDPSAGSSSDNSGSTSSDNYYKNRRGLTDTNKQICTSTATDAADWGEMSAACDSGYYNYSHVYTCTESFVTSLDDCTYTEDGTNPDITPCGDNQQCVFRPRVHVRDNWGWCTGECPTTDTGTDTVNGGTGCYDGDGSIGTSYSDHDECDLSRPDGVEAPKSEDDPWVYYNGVITVAP